MIRSGVGIGAVEGGPGGPGLVAGRQHEGALQEERDVALEDKTVELKKERE